MIWNVGPMRVISSGEVERCFYRLIRAKTEAQAQQNLDKTTGADKKGLGCPWPDGFNF